MTTIRTFVAQTTLDLRGGRQSWRVVSLLCSSAFAISIGTSLLH
ncbi:MAG: hypothetical protein ABIP63_00595 [Thermoanaerobaculia bacterium]